MICPVCLRSSLSPDVQICEKVSTGLWLSYAIHMNSIRMQMQFIFSAEGIAGNLRHSILIRMVLCCSRKGLTETAGSSGRGIFGSPSFDASGIPVAYGRSFHRSAQSNQRHRQKKRFLILCAKQRILNFLYP